MPTTKPKPPEPVDMPAVLYTGPWGDYSGMGEACRNAVSALLSAGVKVKTQRTMHVKDSTDYGKSFKLASKLENSDLDYMIKIIHTTPDIMRDHLEPLKYHIAHFFWETDKIPAIWAWNMNLMNEVWTGCELTKKVLEDSGVQVPIYVFPQSVDTGIIESTPFKISKKEGYTFYSIFEWTERKNPKRLLQSYWKEFKTDTKTTLLLKIYKSDFSSRNRDFIKAQIKEWKVELDQNHYPNVLICLDILSKDQMLKLHASGDCFISAHRGEGWGIPQTEALLFKKPVISTNYGGVHEWLDDKKFYPVEFDMIPVFGMESSYYDKTQRWADPTEDSLRKQMRFVFDNQKEARATGRRGHNFVKKFFSYDLVGQQMTTRLAKIVERYK